MRIETDQAAAEGEDQAIVGKLEVPAARGAGNGPVGDADRIEDVGKWQADVTQIRLIVAHSNCKTPLRNFHL